MSIEEIRKRTAARKRAGIVDKFPQHAAGALGRCPHLGLPTGEVRECQTCSGKVELKVLACAVHGSCTPMKQLDGLACCANCLNHPARTKVATAAPRDPWKHLVHVPQPPAYTGAVSSPRAVVTVVTGAVGAALWSVSEPLMRAYAERMGADLVVLDWPGNPEWPMSAKFALGPVLEKYDRAIFADADVLFRPGCLDLFAECEPDEVGAYSDLTEVLRLDPHFIAEYQRTIELLAGAKTPVPYYLNTGILVLSRQHRGFFGTPNKPIPPLHCAEQHWWNANLIRAGVSVKLLRREANWQWWVDHLRAPVPAAAVIHLSGWVGSLAERVALMRTWTAPQEAGIRDQESGIRKQSPDS